MQAAPSTALVTGGARRIGAACVRALVRRSIRVVLHYATSASAAQALQQELAHQGGEVHLLQGDLAEPEQTRSLLEQAETLLGGQPVTLLINNAAIFERGSIRECSSRQWERHLAINLTAPFLLTREFARRLPAEMSGQIVQIIDQHADRPRPGYAAYSAAKSALWTLTRQAALELAPAIRVNAIGPGPILPAPHDSPEAFARIGAATPLGRAGHPDDIASALLFLLDNSFLTGTLIHVDGGEHLR
ncbi:MAG: SDR family oxidoreductase [Magnetococcales bacterium]|nr:SDR family oxidoreductase [Magnetococcales bacterium]